MLHAGRDPRLCTALRDAGVEVMQTVGSATEARQALLDGASGLVVQGREAGGHTVGIVGVDAALAAILEVAGSGCVWAAGGVADARDVQRLLAAGADAVVSGTRSC